jgi:hypothetical protein
MLAAEQDRLAVRMQNLGARLDEAASNDQGLMAVSLLLFWPAAFALGNKQQEAEYGYLKGQSDAVQQAAVAKKCASMAGTPTMQPLVEPTAPAVALPIQPTSYQPAPGQGVARIAPAPRYRPPACDWPNVKQGVGAC